LIILTAATVAAIAVPLMNGVASAQADVDVRVGPPGVKIAEPRRRAALARLGRQACQAACAGGMIAGWAL
jgi:hypothetical protein